MTPLEFENSNLNHKHSPIFRVAIIGGGPGGLFAGWHLEHKAGSACKIAIFEATERVGGKLTTGEFAGVGPYEAGVAEIYDYSALGPDPLRELIETELGLEIKNIAGGPCVLDGQILQHTRDLATYFSEAAYHQAAGFRARCAELYSPQSYYQSLCELDRNHPWANLSAEKILALEIPDYTARRYIRTMCHSDVAAPPHLSSGLNLLKNVLMDVEGYMNIFAVVGGNGQVATRLAEELSSEIRLNSPVRSVEALVDGSYRLEVGTSEAAETIEADYVILALPLTALSIIKWRSEKLQRAAADHLAYFDRPAHYLRATLLFERPFWREVLSTAWWMVDAFDGCCVYDEGVRLDLGQWGALGFLIAGNAALELTNYSDERIRDLCLDALPPALAEGRRLFVDCRIHRWVASVSALPGGPTPRSRHQNHRPDPENLPGIFIIGDYMFDATINGVLDSADVATDMVLADILERRRAAQMEGSPGARKASEEDPQDVALDLLFSAGSIADLMRVAWDLPAQAKVLLLGSGCGKHVKELRDLGFDAYGIEARPSAHARTPEEIAPFNILGDLPKLPFPNDFFDVVVEAGLCSLPRADAPSALRELNRVARRGLLFGSRTTDLAIDVLERHSLLEGVETLASRWDWSELLLGAGFSQTLVDPLRLNEAWKCVVAHGGGSGRWYEDPESLLYCVYSVGRKDRPEGRVDE
jgi:monoamine oxidase/SAM-dependent methyltransferase